MKKLYKTLLSIGLLSLSATLVFAQSDKPETQDKSVLSRDHKLALKAIKKARKDRDVSNIRRGLKSRFFGIKRLSVNGIKTLDDIDSFLLLTDALRSNQSLVGGGTEIAIEQRKLSVEIIKTLQHFTGLGFGITESLDLHKRDDPEFIDQVIKESLEWWESNKENL